MQARAGYARVIIDNAPSAPTGPSTSNAPTRPVRGPLDKICAVCGNEAPLKCARCSRAHYCGAAHQRERWARHRQRCAILATLKQGAPFKPSVVLKPEGDDMLCDLTEQEVYELLTESYRLRVEDEYTSTGELRGPYAAAADGGNAGVIERDFGRYYGNAVKRGVLPTWWHRAYDKKRLYAYALPKVAYATEASDTKEQYASDPMAVMALRMLAQKIEGRSAMASAFG